MTTKWIALTDLENYELTDRPRGIPKETVKALTTRSSDEFVIFPNLTELSDDGDDGC